nr:signal peptidase II [uncultured Blautia sp.]
MKNKQRRKTFAELVIIVLLLTGLDQWTKFLAVEHLKDQADIPLIPNVLYLKYLENRGAAFGIFQGRKIFLLFLTSLVILGVCYVLWKLPEEKKFRWLKWLCFLICSGGIGNMIDRVRLHYVVDFIYFSLIDFPIFNVADIYVTGSMILLLILVLFYYKEEDFSFLSWKKNKEQE